MFERILSPPMNKCISKSSRVWINANLIDKLKKSKSKIDNNFLGKRTV